MGAVNSIVDIVNGITRLAMALIPLAIVLGVLLGANIPIFGGVIEEIVRIVKIFAGESLIGLVTLAIVVWLFSISTAKK